MKFRLHGVPSIRDARSLGLEATAKIKLYNSKGKVWDGWSVYVTGYDGEETLFAMVWNRAGSNPIVIGAIHFHELERLERQYKFKVTAKQDFKPKPLYEIVQNCMHDATTWIGNYKHVVYLTGPVS